MKAYLAGGFYPDWREEIDKADLGFVGFNPLKGSDQSASYRFVRDDLAAIEDADFLLAYYPGGYASHGMAAEMGYAAALKKPIYLIDASPVPDLFLIGLSRRFFTSISAFIEWWRKSEEKGRSLP